MTKQTEALRMAINVLELYEERMNSSIAMEVIQACKEALAERQPNAEQTTTNGVVNDNETQETVGYVDGFGNFEFTMQMWMEEEPNVTWTPLYTTPPSREWVGLSDAEIEEAVNYLNVKIDYPIMFARLIEMHLKEKNELFGNSR